MTEFALVAPLLFLILLVTIDFGRLVYTYGVIYVLSARFRPGALLEDQSGDRLQRLSAR